MNEEENKIVDDVKYWGMDQNMFCMFMHLSQFSSCLIPGAGLVLPIVMWATNKDSSPTIDQHGKNIINWMISALIYMAISFVLTTILIGFVGLFVVGLLAVIFPIIGAVKANSGISWKYPLTFNFIK
jgi:uncharacterized Tic20 family protein